MDNIILCPPRDLPPTGAFASDPKPEPRAKPNYSIWIANDADVHMVITSTISELDFRHVQGTTSHALWSSLERAFAPQSSSTKYT